MYSFNDIGFLSKDLDQWEKNSRIEFGAEVKLAERINRLAMRIMFALPTENITDEKAMAAAAFGQATESYQISLQLALKDAMCESRAVTQPVNSRAAWTAAALAANNKNFSPCQESCLEII